MEGLQIYQQMNQTFFKKFIGIETKGRLMNWKKAKPSFPQQHC